jgi:hypothetical protein
MANRRIRWIASAATLRVGGGGIAVAPDVEFDIDAAQAEELVDQERAEPVGWERETPRQKDEKDAAKAAAKAEKQAEKDAKAADKPSKFFGEKE